MVNCYDSKYMRLALKLAKRGWGRTTPNPLAGAVIVKDGEVVGKGFHRAVGEPHAEVVALREAGERAQGATLYVNLEPCCHWGRTPPCTQAIIRAGISRVVASIKDPSPQVKGKGFRELSSQGIEVKVRLLADEAARLNEFYLKYTRTRFPFVILKLAQTLDGKIATSEGRSRYITSLKSRRRVHWLRSGVDAVMVGVGTVLQDDPQLTVRHIRGRNPLRIVLDSRGRTPPQAKVISSDGKAVIMTTSQAPPSWREEMERRGTEVWEVPSSGDGRIDLREAMRVVGAKGTTSLMIEGGRGVFTSFLKADIADKLLVFLSPKVMGEGIGGFGDLGVRELSSAYRFYNMKVQRMGEDFLITAYVHGDS